MEQNNIDLSSVWGSIIDATKSQQQEQNNLQGASAFAGSGTSSSASSGIVGSIVKSVLTNALNSSSSGSNGGGSNGASSLNLLAIASQLMSLYNKFKGSSNATEAAAANNAKAASDVIGSLGQVLAGQASGNAGGLGDVLGSILGGGQQTQQQAQQSSGGMGDILGSILGGGSQSQQKSNNNADILNAGINILGGILGKK